MRGEELNIKGRSGYMFSLDLFLNFPNTSMIPTFFLSFCVMILYQTYLKKLAPWLHIAFHKEFKAGIVVREY